MIKSDFRVFDIKNFFLRFKKTKNFFVCIHFQLNVISAYDSWTAIKYDENRIFGFLTLPIFFYAFENSTSFSFALILNLMPFLYMTAESNYRYDKNRIVEFALATILGNSLSGFYMYKTNNFSPNFQNDLNSGIVIQTHTFINE